MASEGAKQVLELLASTPAPAEPPTVAQQRANMEAATAAFPVPEDATITPVTANGVPGEWVAMPGASDKHAVLYLHGGGYVIGSPKTHRSLAAALAKETGAKLLVIDYRMGPEDACPAAIDDAVAAYEFLLAEGYDAANLAIAGDSAGGGLTVATLVALRDKGVALPAAAAPISPWVDLTGNSPTMETRKDVDPMVQKDGLLAMAAHYKGDLPAEDPRVSPLFAELNGLPPLLIQVGDHETLLGDSEELDKRARAAGVETRLEIWDEMVHVFHMFHFMMPEAAEANRRIGEFFRIKWGVEAASAAE
jgi:acetyl esterase/lipase